MLIFRWLVLLLLALLQPLYGISSRFIALSWQRSIKSFGKAFSISAFLLFPTSDAHAGMLTFPLPYPLKNNIVLVRSGECFADSRHETETNPVKKLRQDNALTMKGREEAVEAAKSILAMGFSPTYIWTSNTERSYETAAIIARECQLGQNRIVPEYSFLDARAVGKYEGQNDELAWKEIHDQDDKFGIKYKPPPATDGTPSESVSDVLVRGNQVVSTIEGMYSGDNVVIVSPDSEVLSILTAATIDDTPDDTLPHHAKYGMKNGEVRPLVAFIHPPDTLATGQTQREADLNSLKMRALRVAGSAKGVQTSDDDTWMNLWHSAIDYQGI